MVRAFYASVFFLFVAAAPVPAQPADPPVATTPSATADAASEPDSGWPLTVRASEWMVSAGPAFGVVLFHSAADHRYLLQTVSWGRVLSGPKLSGPLRGRFEWAVEAVPIFGQFSPSDTYGVGVSPIVWRWNFAPSGRFAPFAEVAGGGLWTHDPVPDRTTTINYTAHAGYGVRYFLRPQQALVVGYRLHHISNGNRLDRNPGVNAHVFQVGFSSVRPRP